MVTHHNVCRWYITVCGVRCRGWASSCGRPGGMHSRNKSIDDRKHAQTAFIVICSKYSRNNVPDISSLTDADSHISSLISIGYQVKVVLLTHKCIELYSNICHHYWRNIHLLRHFDQLTHTCWMKRKLISKAMEIELSQLVPLICGTPFQLDWGKVNQ